MGVRGLLLGRTAQYLGLALSPDSCAEFALRRWWVIARHWKLTFSKCSSARAAREPLATAGLLARLQQDSADIHTHTVYVLLDSAWL